MLPFANEVKLASLLAGARGDMDAVVQENMDSSNNPEVENEREGERIIDLTDDDDEKCLTEARIKQLASMPIETAALKEVIKTVEENETAKANCNFFFVS